MNDLTYFESLKVSWFVQRRTILLSFVLGLITAALGIRMDPPIQSIIISLVIFVVMPIFFRLAVRKPYEGFRFQVIREAHENITTCSGE